MFLLTFVSVLLTGLTALLFESSHLAPVTSKTPPETNTVVLNHHSTISTIPNRDILATLTRKLMTRWVFSPTPLQLQIPLQNKLWNREWQNKQSVKRGSFRPPQPRTCAQPPSRGLKRNGPQDCYDKWLFIFLLSVSDLSEATYSNLIRSATSSFDRV